MSPVIRMTDERVNELKSTELHVQIFMLKISVSYCFYENCIKLRSAHGMKNLYLFIYVIYIYAIITESESDLQYLLDVMYAWCNRNCMRINYTKTNVIHFRNQSVTRSEVMFKCGETVIEYTDKYI